MSQSSQFLPLLNAKLPTLRSLLPWLLLVWLSASANGQDCQGRTDLDFVECDLELLNQHGKSQLQALELVKKLTDRAYKCKVPWPNSLELYLKLPDSAADLQKWRKERQSDPQHEKMEFQFYGLSSGGRVTRRAGTSQSNADTSKYYGLPPGGPATVEGLFTQLKLSSGFRDKVGLSLLEFVFIPRIEPQGEDFIIYPVTAIPAVVLDSMIEMPAPPGGGSPRRVRLRGWMRSLEFAGVQYLQVIKDWVELFDGQKRLEKLEFLKEQVLFFDQRMEQELTARIEASSGAGLEVPLKEVGLRETFQRFWDAVKAELATLEDSSTSTQ